MKKLLYLFFLLILNFTLKAQYPITQNLGSDSTLIRIGPTYNGAIKGGLINMAFNDTTDANLSRISFYTGAQIWTNGDSSLWVRKKSIYGSYWFKVSGSGAGPSGSGWQVSATGQMFPVTVPYRGLGTDATYGGAVGLVTNGVARAIVPNGGFVLDNDTTSNKIFTWNPSTKDWGYANWNNGGGGLGMKVRRSLEITSDSAQLLNDSASFASGAVKVYGYDTTRGWKNAAKIVLTNPQDKDGLRYKSSNATWVNYSLIQKRLQFQVSVTTNAPTPGDSTLTNQGFYAKHLRLYREGLMQTQDDTIVGFELSDSLLTVHPPWVEGERVIVETSDTTVWETLALSPPPPVDSSWVNLPFGTVVQLTNTDSIWQSTVGLGSGWGNYGISSLKLPAGQDGGVRFKYTGSDGQYGLIGFRTSNTNGNYTTWDAGVGIVGTSWTTIESGTPGFPGGTASVGDYIVLRRTGSTLKMQKSSDGGATYTDLYTFTFTSSADLYILINCSENQKLRFPRGLNVE